MKIQNPFSKLTRLEWGLLILSLVIVSLSSVLSPEWSILSLLTSLIGVTALIFVAKGMAFGQLLIIIFSVLYGIISLTCAYYGEMITYLFMSAPAAVASLIAWLRNPYEETDEVRVRTYLSARLIIWLLILSAAVTVIFYFILSAFNTSSLIFSTLSVTTSFFAAALTFLRSPYYALGYAANDIVLIVLWVLATLDDVSYLPMIFCFIMFLVNDLYGYFNWRKMQKRQS